MERLTAEVGEARGGRSNADLRITGIQFLPFNTIYQLAAARETPDYWPRAAS